MTIVGAIKQWLQSTPRQEKAAEIHQTVRQAVHDSRNVAARSIYQSIVDKRVSNRVVSVAQRAIETLEGRKCDD